MGGEVDGEVCDPGKGRREGGGNPRGCVCLNCRGGEGGRVMEGVCLLWPC